MLINVFVSVRAPRFAGYQMTGFLVLPVVDDYAVHRLMLLDEDAGLSEKDHYR